MRLKNRLNNKGNSYFYSLLNANSTFRALREKKQKENEKLKKELEEAQKQLEEVKKTYNTLKSKDDNMNDFEETTAGSSKSFGV